MREKTFKCPDFKLYGEGKGNFNKIKPHPFEKELKECREKSKNRT